MKKILTVISVLCVSAMTLSAQVKVVDTDYNKAVGIKGGPNGVKATYKQFVLPGQFVDAAAGLFVTIAGNGATQLFGGAQAAYCWNFNIPGVKGFYWYAGPGMKLSLTGGRFEGIPEMDIPAESWVMAQIGFFGQIGIEYCFPQVPLAISFDWNPGLDIYASQGGGACGFGWEGFNLGLKYRF